MLSDRIQIINYRIQLVLQSDLFAKHILNMTKNQFLEYCINENINVSSLSTKDYEKLFPLFDTRRDIKILF